MFINQFKWRLLKKASQVLYLHFALKKRVLIDEICQNKEQVYCVRTIILQICLQNYPIL